MQEYDQLELRDLESELYHSNEDYGNDREYCTDDDDDDDLSYIETGRSSATLNVTELTHRGTLPADVINYNCDVSEDSGDDEKDYMALRSLVLYGRIFICLFRVVCLNAL